MTKSKRAFAAIFILGLVWYFAFDRTPPAQKTSTKTRIAASDFSPLVIRNPATANSQTAGHSEPQLVNAEIPPPKPETEQECWDREVNQIPQTPGFLGYVKDDLDDVAGPWLYDDRSQPELKAGAPKSARFLYALARGGFLISSDRKFERNEEEAYDLLMQLAFDDRDNSAPFLFLAALQKRKPEPNEELIDAYLRMARDRSHFETYKKDIGKAVMKHVKTPEDYVASANILATIPEPEVSAFQNLLKDKEFAPIAKQMMADGIKVKKPVYGVNYVQWEYRIGEKILENMGVVEPYPKADEIFSRAVYSKCYTGVAEDAVAAIHEVFNGSSIE